MKYWLLKSEPETFSWSDQVLRGDRGEPWSGVRNYQARLNLRAMAAGDLAFFYHSGGAREIVGIVKVIRTSYPDPTDQKGVWSAVDVSVVKAFAKPVSLIEIKEIDRLRDMMLVKNTRLSVQPVQPAEWKIICKMGGVTS